jgi:hypothetical protein
MFMPVFKVFLLIIFNIEIADTFFPFFLQPNKPDQLWIWESPCEQQ